MSCYANKPHEKIQTNVLVHFCILCDFHFIYVAPHNSSHIYIDVF